MSFYRTRFLLFCTGDWPGDHLKSMSFHDSPCHFDQIWPFFLITLNAIWIKLRQWCIGNLICPLAHLPTEWISLCPFYARRAPSMHLVEHLIDDWRDCCDLSLGQLAPAVLASLFNLAQLNLATERMCSSLKCMPTDCRLPLLSNCLPHGGARLYSLNF